MIYLLFFLSGAAALVYQVLWVRSLTLVFGGSHLAVTAVLSTFMAGLQVGDNSANRIAPFTLAGLSGLSQITRVELNLHGSGGVDNVTFEPVPEPTTALLLALGVIGLGARARARRV